mmetsp:Transcript_5562/g.11015  ORF Transcript_5562/g.11015 Transcript_5562/m.11015 type:complete len:211 (-) Transcript_5562:34-666(-)
MNEFRHTGRRKHASFSGHVNLSTTLLVHLHSLASELLVVHLLEHAVDLAPHRDVGPRGVGVRGLCALLLLLHGRDLLLELHDLCHLVGLDLLLLLLGHLHLLLLLEGGGREGRSLVGERLLVGFGTGGHLLHRHRGCLHRRGVVVLASHRSHGSHRSAVVGHGLHGDVGGHLHGGAHGTRGTVRGVGLLLNVPLVTSESGTTRLLLEVLL